MIFLEKSWAERIAKARLRLYQAMGRFTISGTVGAAAILAIGAPLGCDASSLSGFQSLFQLAAALNLAIASFDTLFGRATSIEIEDHARRILRDLGEFREQIEEHLADTEMIEGAGSDPDADQSAARKAELSDIREEITNALTRAQHIAGRAWSFAVVSPTRAVNGYEAIFATGLSLAVLLILSVYAEARPAPILTRAVIGFIAGLVYSPLAVVGYYTIGSIDGTRRLKGDLFKLNQQFIRLSRRIHQIVKARE